MNLLVISLQYFGPYRSADLSKMALAFNTTVVQLEDELMQLILDNKISARIDSHNKVRIFRYKVEGCSGVEVEFLFRHWICRVVILIL